MTDRLTPEQRLELVQWVRAGARPRLEHRTNLTRGYLLYVRTDEFYRAWLRPNDAAIELAEVYGA